jgi:hypothetical protein
MLTIYTLLERLKQSEADSITITPEDEVEIVDSMKGLFNPNKTYPKDTIAQLVGTAQNPVITFTRNTDGSVTMRKEIK